ncbi:hypothetical protein GVN20_24600 [Runella sp. CRIBMP]|uniref:hypothetical protein n=1 Tax=Runella sp. CRIBMP TaxID=2683261 RepID=UPI00141378E5|nr:hypothetical protein [Runella sp. CRIBMP]NBB22557.1 hypothetical protein [Runella sp. CRIBMP]
MEIFKTLLERWQGPMPKFFKVLFYLAAAIVALSAGANLFIEQIVSVGLVPPKFLTDVAGWAAGAAAIVAKFTVDWNEKRRLERLKSFKP